MSATKNDKKPFAYFKSLDIENIKCFKGKHHIDLTDKDGKPAKWTVIMGNNGTGKTTILRCLADLEPHFMEEEDEEGNIMMTLQTAYLEDKNLYNWSGKDLSHTQVDFIDENGELLGNSEVDCNELHSLGFFPLEDESEYDIELAVYGIHRRLSRTNLNESENGRSIPKLLDERGLINAEDWLLRTFLAHKNEIERAGLIFEKIKQLLINVLPDVNDLKIETNQESLDSYVNFKTDFGWVRVYDLGYGYQSLMAWLIDFAKYMFEIYPNSTNPLHEPAIVLIDEITLHLHPDWQRDIINYLDTHFPKTQFIVTTHSPLVIQSAENVNLVLLEKDGEGVRISQPEITNLQGWSIEEIMSDIMGLNEEIFSDEYLELMKKFEEALDAESYEMAKVTYDKLDKILHPSSTQRALMKMQMAGIMPLEA